MEKARGFVEEVTTGVEADEVSRLSFPPHRPFIDSSFYEFFAIRGVRLTVLHSDFISCSFKVPPRLIDRNGNLAMGAITSLIDVLGAAVAYQGSQSRNVSVDMSISCISAAKLDDELELESRCLGRRVEPTWSYETKQLGRLLLKGAIHYLIQLPAANCDCGFCINSD